MSSLRAALAEPRVQAELVVAAWEIFSVLLFVSAVAPEAFTTPWPGVLFGGTLVASAALSKRLMASGSRGYHAAAAIRAVAWPLCITPLLSVMDPRVLVAALAFGVMAGGIRRTIYRRATVGHSRDISPTDLRDSLRPRLAESAAMAGIVGGHVLLLFSVAYLRTQSQVIFRAWWDIVPILALLGTVGFTLAIRPATGSVIRALTEGADGDAEVLKRGLRQARKLPDLLAYLNFLLWFMCVGVGVFYFRTGPPTWNVADAVMQLGFGALFAWGVSFYQRGWHKDTVAPVVDRLRGWTGLELREERRTLRHRMMRDFGLPLVFTATISLFASIGLYRTLGHELPLREDFNAISALFASFGVLVVAGFGLVARAARELSRPLSQVAETAEEVARGKLDAAVPEVRGPVEVVGLGESVERMRRTLAQTIAELEEERIGLEERVEERTTELRDALSNLKNAQAALVQGERLASIGELVSGVAHEIYNPLNAIAGSSTSLEQVVEDLGVMLEAYRKAEGELPPGRRKTIEELRRKHDLEGSLDDLVGISQVIKRASDRSVRIVQNLKNFSRASGEPSPADLRAGLEETLMLLAPRLRDRGIEVQKHYGDLPPVTCRSEEMNQVFMNLLVNAIQALEGVGHAGEGAASSRDELALRVDTGVEGEVAFIAIGDSGPGVPDDLEGRIFDPFFTTKPRGQGTGLGLSISTDIIRRHGGTLTVEQSELGGARMVCRIPVAGAKPPKVAPRPTPSSPGSRPTVGRRSRPH